MTRVRTRNLWIALSFALVLAACSAGDPRFSAEAPAGFWMGIWHGMISVITLIFGIFSDNVQVYEVNNTGGWYDAGFLFGTLTIWGSGSKGYQRARRRQRRREREEWEEIGRKVESKLKVKMREWADADEDENWEEIGRKVEAKLKRIVLEWAQKEDGNSGPEGPHG